MGAMFGCGQGEGLDVELGEEGVKSGDTFGLPSGVGPELDVHIVDVVVVFLVGVVAMALHDFPEAFLGSEGLLELAGLDIVDPFLDGQDSDFVFGHDAEDGFELIDLRDADHLAQDIARPAGSFGHMNLAREATNRGDRFERHELAHEAT